MQMRELMEAVAQVDNASGFPLRIEIEFDKLNDFPDELKQAGYNVEAISDRKEGTFIKDTFITYAITFNNENEVMTFLKFYIMGNLTTRGREQWSELIKQMKDKFASSETSPGLEMYFDKLIKDDKLMSDMMRGMLELPGFSPYLT